MTNTTDTTTLRELLDARFGGLLRHGAHPPNGQVCALELVSQFKGKKRTDSPAETLGIDLRPLNDARWSSDAVRMFHRQA